ncbi:hypothetical protein QFC22_005761 [Naganishia vaughanmartiniae]|uniref:Uncharacterized protein n=1 Tax=Naganishia vaughanmartiniae TaxID=1424756 RepID=A0ACC2WRB1_9TREE|nr:hypothetical protein QFC22_005761 [Naganishia vaughanmartiniae]
MIEQIREKDRQITKLQGNYTKLLSRFNFSPTGIQLQRKNLLGGSSLALASAVNDEVQHSMANIANIAHAPRLSRGRGVTSENFPAQSPILTTPATKAPQSHQPQAFIPASARRNETPAGLFDLDQRRSSERQQQYQQQLQREAYEAERKADAHTYHEDHQEHHRQSRQGNHRGIPQENQNVMRNNQTSSRRHPAISPDQQALLTGVMNRHSYSSRQPLGISTINSNSGPDARTPMLNNVKSHTDIRALNDSGFGMKPPVANVKAVVEKHRYQQQPPETRLRADNQSAQIMTNNMQDRGRTSSYADRIMALPGRGLAAGQQQGGGAGSMLRKEVRPRRDM